MFTRNQKGYKRVMVNANYKVLRFADVVVGDHIIHNDTVWTVEGLSDNAMNLKSYGTAMLRWSGIAPNTPIFVLLRSD